MPVIKLPEAETDDADCGLLIQEGGTTRILKTTFISFRGVKSNYCRTNSYLLRYLMSQTVIQYEIYLPLQYNDGTWIEEEKYNHVHQRLFDRFGGVTHIMRDFPLRVLGESMVKFITTM